ncbi:MAG: hypothetical protein ABIP48_10585 [Planctomycetota bacterium]
MRSSIGMVLVTLWASLALAGESWPEFRGPTADGHSDSTGLPLEWSETKNIAWKTPIHSHLYRIEKLE